MPESRARVLVGVSKSQLIADRVLLQESKRVADSNVVVGFGFQAGPDEVGPQHDEKIRARAGLLPTARSCAGGGFLRQTSGR